MVRGPQKMFMSIWCANTQMHKYTSTQIHKYTNTQIQRHIPFCSHSAMSVRALTHSSSFLEYQKKQVWVVTTIIKLVWEVQKSSFSPNGIVCVVAHRVFLLVIWAGRYDRGISNVTGHNRCCELQSSCTLHCLYCDVLCSSSSLWVRVTNVVPSIRLNLVCPKCPKCPCNSPKFVASHGDTAIVYYCSISKQVLMALANVHI